MSPLLSAMQQEESEGTPGEHLALSQDPEQAQTDHTWRESYIPALESLPTPGVDEQSSPHTVCLAIIL